MASLDVYATKARLGSQRQGDDGMVEVWAWKILFGSEAVRHFTLLRRLRDGVTLRLWGPDHDYPNVAKRLLELIECEVPD